MREGNGFDRQALDHYLTTPPEPDDEACYDCGSLQIGGLTTWQDEHADLEVCDECYRQREADAESEDEI